MTIGRPSLIIGTSLVLLGTTVFATGPVDGQPARATYRAGPTATPTPSPPVPLPADTDTHPVLFSLDAARVSPVNNPGNKRGFAAVRPGATVWLMMYYTIDTVAAPANRAAVYTVLHDGKVVFTNTFRGSVGPTDTGHSVRYTQYTVPASASYGRYIFEAALTIAGRRETKSWSFEVAARNRMAPAAASTNPTANPSFLVYAARVAAVGNPGNLLGLPAAPAGKTVWLMMYYAVARMPGDMSWVATYTVSRSGRRVHRFRFHGQFTAGATGKFIRYVAYTLPRSRGRYSFVARLAIGGEVQYRTWGFTVTAPLK